jgi:hypothetical protein
MLDPDPDSSQSGSTTLVKPDLWLIQSKTAGIRPNRKKGIAVQTAFMMFGRYSNGRLKVNK